MDHPVSDTVLGHVLTGTATRQELREVVAHLLRGCPDCAGRLRARLRREVPDAAYDRALDRLEASLRAALEEPESAVSVLWAVVDKGRRGGRGLALLGR